MKKTIYFVRHGESSMNVGASESVYGGISSPLTERGCAQAELLSIRAKALPIGALIASDTTRAQETAAVISREIKKPVEISDIFNERKSPSSLIGRPWNDEETQRLEKMWVQTFYQEDARVLDGENFSDITRRAVQALEHLQNHSANHILVVSHAFFIHTLAAQVLFGKSLSPGVFRTLTDGLHMIGNTGLSMFSFDSNHSVWSLQVWNDHSHLA